MMKTLTKLFLTLLISILLIHPFSLPVQAQSQTLTPTALPTVGNTLLPTVTPSNNLITPTATPILLNNQDVVTFSQFQRGDANTITLNGPYDSRGIGFALPANWQLKEGIELNLQYGVSYNTEIQGDADVFLSSGGILNVFLNGNLILPINLNKLGDVETRFTIPLSAFDTLRSDGLNILSFTLESYDSCRFLGQNTTVFIYPTSYLTLPHNIVNPSVNLLNFPRPIYQNSFEVDQALIVVPDQPSAEEIQAALTVAAGLGKLSANNLKLDLTTVQNMANKNFGNTHLILIGKSSSLPNLNELKLPMPVVDGKFQSTENNVDAGIIQMVDSPWSSGPHVVLLLSADTDKGVIQAAQAISTGVLRPNRFENLSIVEQVNVGEMSNFQPVDRTLAELGYSVTTFENRGFNSEEYVFNIPHGMTISSNSYFDLIYGHSAVLDYDNSQITVSINDQPIGSVRMTDESSKLPTNQIRFTIPLSVVKSGDNFLNISANMVSINECAPEDSQGLWTNIWPESNLHLPLLTISSNPLTLQDLSIYPAPFSNDPFLSTTAFIVERNNYESWANAVKIASLLGWQTTGSMVALSAFYGDEIPTSALSNYNLLIVGRPSQLPIITEINPILPAPFDIGNDIADESKGFQVIYRIPPDSPMGYIEILQSPWNTNNVILGILGNTYQGVDWATNALVDSTLSWQLGGNFAVINNQQILLTNSINFSTTGGEEEVTDGQEDLPIPTSVNEELTSISPVTSARPTWVLALIIIATVLLSIVLGIVVLRNFSNFKSFRRNSEK